MYSIFDFAAKQAINPPGIYEYAFGQVGSSAAFTEVNFY